MNWKNLVSIGIGLFFVPCISGSVAHSQPNNEIGEYAPYSTSGSQYEHYQNSSSNNKRFRVVVDQSKAEVRVYEIYRDQPTLVKTMPAGVAKNAEWTPRSGAYEVTLLAERYTFKDPDWGVPYPRGVLYPRAGCAVQIAPTDGQPAIKQHPENVILFHTEPKVPETIKSSKKWHPSHNACRIQNGQFVKNLSEVRADDLFKGPGKRSHGCIRLSGVNARYLFKMALRHPRKLQIIVKK